MEPILISLKEEAGINRVAEPVCLGIPLSKCVKTQQMNFILTANGQPVECQVSPLSYRPNGTLRWVKTQFQVDLAPFEETTLVLKPHSTQVTSEPLFISQDEKHVCVDSGAITFQLNNNALEWHVHSSVDFENWNTTYIQLRDANGFPCSAVLDGAWRITESGPVCVTALAQGRWLQKNDTSLARFKCRLRIFSRSSIVRVEITIHNPKRARHKEGLWDLGDPGSIHFKSLCAKTTLRNAHRIHLSTGDKEQSTTQLDGETVRIYQDSSGGEQWNSRNHLDASGCNITPVFRGYQVHLNGKLAQEGHRANPILSADLEMRSVAVSLKAFWQNFPSALSAEQNHITVELFPKRGQYLYELQGGEQKTHTLFIDYANNSGSLQWTQEPLIPLLTSRHYQIAEAFTWFDADGAETGIDSLIQQGLTGKHNFQVKREIIDEYGWRNFGEIFADHETLYQNLDEKPLVSHYNNQYDPIYGFARQFAQKGDRCWFQLMDELAQHVADIDLYHTDEDRAEYNNGLFWHTDHYLDAHTATHRTFSRLNETSSTGQIGGGPAPEHCYSTGFLYHYFLTGNEASSEAVVGLARWMLSAHEGNGGLLDQILSIKKHETPKLKALLKGDKPTTHRYSFTRGTGNYINTLLDAWRLTNDRYWLAKAENVIRDTIHPADDIPSRQLLNAETGWSYLVLLDSVSRYISTKLEADEEDENYQFALDAFAHYTRWMAENERPFLSDPAQLEYPNDTWAAQDIRKAMLMFQAAYFDPDHETIYLHKAREWFDSVISALSNSNESHFSRIIILMMLNYGPHHSLPTHRNARNRSANSCQADQPLLTWSKLISRISSKLTRGILTFHPGREVTWLKTRLHN